MSKKSGAKAGRKETRGAARRIIAEPSEEELRPSEDEKQEINRLLEWENRSKKRDWVVGAPCSK